MGREKYLLKKQRKEQERFEKARRKKIKKIVKISLPVILITGGAIFALVIYSPEESQGTPKIEVSPWEYDSGTVSMAEGLVKKTYEVQNKGNGDLKISRIWTSCHCTTAILKAGDKTSPEFGMSNNSAFWSQKIAPGETGYLEVIFDPTFHGSHGTGPVARVVYLSTNDPKNKEVELKLLANVIE